MNKFRICLFFVICLIISCSKDDESLFVITLIDTTPINIVEFEENIMVKITYCHNDGYVGFYNPDSLSLEIKDSRLSNADYYHLIPVNPPDEFLSLQGEVLIEIDSPFILGNGNSESLTYTIRIQDRELNWSNSVTTPLITVTKQ